MNEENYVDAIYITEDGTAFESKAAWPHQNFITLKWEQDDGEEDVLKDYIYFGSHNNRLIYHDIQIENQNPYLS